MGVRGGWTTDKAPWVVCTTETWSAVLRRREVDNWALIDTVIFGDGEEIDSACWRRVVNVKNLIQRGRAEREEVKVCIGAFETTRPARK